VEAREAILAWMSNLEHDNGKDRDGCKMRSGFLGVCALAFVGMGVRSLVFQDSRLSFGL